MKPRVEEISKIKIKNQNHKLKIKEKRENLCLSHFEINN